MTLTNCYLTVAEFKTLSRITSSSDDSLIEYFISAACRQVDRYTGRPHGFWQDATVTTREYHADDEYCVYVDDISTSTGLIVKTDTADAGTFSTTLTITTDFLLYPLNAADEYPVRPWDVIKIASGSSYYFPTTTRPGVQVTAKFGWPATPDDVKLAAILQSQMLYSAKDARAGILQNPVEGFSTPMSRKLHPQAQLLLEDFVKERP